MPEPLDHQIVQGVVTALRQIKRAAGYRTNVGQQVIGEEDQDIDDGLTVIEVIDDEESAQFQNCKRRTAQLDITLIINMPVAEVDQAVRRDARRIFADIRQALASVDCRNWIPGVSELQIAGRSMFYRDAGSRFFRPEMKVRATFHETHRSNES